MCSSLSSSSNSGEKGWSLPGGVPLGTPSKEQGFPKNIRTEVAKRQLTLKQH